MGYFTAPSIYSPDILPSNYWLFGRVEHELAGHWLTSVEEIENWLQTLIDSEDEMISPNGIRKSPETWEK